MHGKAEVTPQVRERLVTQLPYVHILLDAVPPLAIEIADSAQIEEAVKKGSSWFCGPYIAHPPPVPGNHHDAGRANLLRLITLVAQDADTSEIEGVFKRDVGLSFHLFRIVNAPSMGLSRKIASFSDAIMVLGRRQLQRWIQLLLYASKRHETPSPLFAFAAMRGRMMEQISYARGRDESVCELAFMIGMFSLLDSLLGMPMDDIAQEACLPGIVQQALLTQQGEFGELLRWVEAVQSGAATGLPAGINADQCLNVQLEAMNWASSVGKDIG